MIKPTGFFYENDYLRVSRELDTATPDMSRIAAVVLAIDISRRPIKRKVDANSIEYASFAELKAFFKRFDAIDEEDPEPLPLQVYDGQPAIEHVAKALLEAQVGRVVVLTRPDVLDEVQKLLAGLDVEVLEYDEARAAALDARWDGSRIEMLSRGQIVQAAQSALDGQRGTFDSLLVMHADQVSIEPRHLRRLRASFEQDPDADFHVSYVEWRHSLPVLLSRRFCDELATTDAHEPKRVEGARIMPCRIYSNRTCLMGEEKLNGPYPIPSQADEEDALPESALDAVAKARHVPTRDEKRMAFATGVKPNPHIKRAAAFLAAIDESLEKRPIDGLDEAEAFAQRNRLDFPILSTRDNEGFVYLDAAATSLQPASVVACAREFAEHYDANVWRGMYANSAYATKRYQAAREKVAGFISADPREVIFTSNTSVSINLVADAWARHMLHEGDLIGVMLNEHHSNLLPWIKAADACGASVEIVPIGVDGRVDWDAYAALLARGPKLIAAAHVSNVIGLENPIRRMARAAHEAGAVFALDAAQSIPHIALDVSKLDVDFVSFSGHKLHAPTGVGVLWARSERMAEMQPFQVGGGTISEVSLQGTYWRQTPYCFEIGTPPIEQAIALGGAIDYLQALGMDNVKAHVRAMSRYALRIAGHIEGLRVWGDHGKADGCLGLLSYSMDACESQAVTTLLSKMGVATRAGGHCAVQLMQALGTPGTTRISFGPYTTKADVEAWGYAMHVIAELTRDDVPRI